MPDEKEQLATIIAPEQPPIAQELMPRRFRNWIVSDRELRTLGLIPVFGTLLVAAFGVTASAGVTLWITLETVSIAEPKTYSTFFAVSIACGILSAVFLIGSALTFYFAFRDVKNIKNESLQEQRRRDLEAEQRGFTIPLQ
jgi:hypothetical protein